MAERALTVKDVAAEYGVTPATVYGWIKEGDLVPLKLPGGTFRFRRAQLDEFDRRCLAANSTSPTIGSTHDEDDGSSTGPIRPVVAPAPFQQGRLTAARRKSGATNG